MSKSELPGEFLECLGTIRIRPGDTIVLKMKGEMTEARARRLDAGSAYLRAKYKAEVIILSESDEIGVIRNEK